MAANSRILIVDDEAPIRGFLTLAFEQAGYDVRSAGSGPDAIALCAGETFDVVLSDVTMPEMNGYELTRWIDTHYPSTRTALMSGFDASDCGGWGRPLIEKPFNPGQVVSFVEQILAQSPAGV